MDNRTLQADKFIALTPAGAYAVSSQPNGGAGYQLLLSILSEQISPALTVENLTRLSGLPAGKALTLLAQLQSAGLVQALEAPKSCSTEALETLLPKLTAKLSDENLALLSDPQGFYMARIGFEHEVAEELAALSTNLAEIHHRHQRLFREALQLPINGWSLTDPSGNSALGFWPLYVGEYRFSLVIAGRPRFNHPAFVALVWALSSRYAKERRAQGAPV